jgi:hypothetical protein
MAYLEINTDTTRRCESYLSIGRLYTITDDLRDRARNASAVVGTGLGLAGARQIAG